MWEWAKLFDDERHIGEDKIGEVEVSTVWVGLDLGYASLFGDGPPLIFETMIFGGERDLWTWRYATEREAREGHKAVCADERLRANI